MSRLPRLFFNLNWLTCLGLFASNPLMACAVCGFGEDDGSRVAFLITTALMTLTPLCVAGLLILVLMKLHKRSGENGENTNLSS